MAVGKEIYIPMHKNTARAPKYTRRFKPALIAASFVLLLSMTLLLGQGLLFNPIYATVSVDINPSIQFGVNRNLEVVAVKAMNHDAEGLLQGEVFHNMGLEQAIQKFKDLSEKQFQVKSMLLAAVIPENDEALRAMLVRLEQTQNTGEETQLVVKARYIYSHDEEVVAKAKQNGLSVGRQMLLNQAKSQNQNYDTQSIAEAPLDELLPKLLGNQERNQSGVTHRTTQSASESNGPSGTQNQGQIEPTGSKNQSQQTATGSQSQQTATGSQNQSQQTATGSQNQTQQTPQGSTFQTKQSASGTQYTTQQTQSGSTCQTQQTPSGSTVQTQQTPSGSSVQTHSGTNSQVQSDPTGTQNTSQKTP